jgi:uncharacterized protein
MGGPAYFEIQAGDVERAVRFYSAVFGWKFTKAEGLPAEYWRIETAGMRGGVWQRPAPAPAPRSGTNAFVSSIEVDDFGEIAQAIQTAGGAVAMPKFALPKVCWQGYFLDTEGNTFGLFQPDANAG